MNIVISDPFLINLLDQIAISYAGKVHVEIGFRTFDRIRNGECGECVFCRVGNSLRLLAKLITRIIDSGFRDLTVFLVLTSEQYLYSTFVLDYIRSLYSLTIQCFSSNESGNPIDIINPNSVNLSILPIFDWRALLNRRISVASDIGCDDAGSLFLYVRDSNYIFDSFYNYIGRFGNGSSKNGQECTKAAGLAGILPPVRRIEKLSLLDCLAIEEDKREHRCFLSIKKYANVMCCGTFDYLHFGHKLLLLVAYLSSYGRLSVGITASKEMLARKEEHSLIQPFQVRKGAVSRYINTLRQSYAYEHDHLPVETRKISEYERLDYHSCDFILFGCTEKRSESPPPGQLETCTVREKLDTTESSKGDSGPNIDIFPLMDTLGPSRYIEEQFAMIIAPESIRGAMDVNNFRRANKMSEWHIVTVGIVVHPGSCRDAPGQTKIPKKLSSSIVRRNLRNKSLKA